MMYRVMQGTVGGLDYSVHWSQNSDDWQIYWKNDELPDMQFMTWEQLLAQLQYLYENKDKIKEYVNLRKTINRYGYEGELHNIEKPSNMVPARLKAKLLREIVKLDPRGYIRVPDRQIKA